METNLLDRLLSSYQDNNTSVIVTLQNKIRVSGKIKAFDSYVIVMDDSKREILYRHAISSVTPQVPEEQKRRPMVVSRPAPVAPAAPAKTAPPRAAAKAQPHKPRPAQQPQALSASSNDGINNSMKDGLLKWMQEQKAAK